jgi:hypothetical protein
VLPGWIDSLPATEARRDSVPNAALRHERRDRSDGSIRTIDEKPRFLGFFVA